MRTLLLIILLCSWHAGGAETRLTVGLNIGPPWAFFEEDKGITGIDVEIIQHICNKLGYNPEFHLLPYSRLIKDFNLGKFDIASPAAFSSTNGHFTTLYLPFKDVVISLKDNNLTVNKLADLADKSVIAYQHATAVLGDEYAAIVANDNYLEFAEREVQLKLLVEKRADVVIGERRLLTYISKKLYPNSVIEIHPIFSAKSYGAVLKDEMLKVRFDQELELMKVSGLYQQILDQWP